MPTIRYEFVPVGKGQIQAEFRSISAEARASKSATDGMYKASVVGAAQAARAAQTYSREAKRPVSDLDRVAKRVAADQERAAKRTADAQIREARRAADAQIREAQRAADMAAKAHARAIKSRREESVKAISSVGRGILGAGTGLLAGGLAMVGGAAREGVRLQDTANRVSINARQAGQGFLDPTMLRKEFETTALANPGQKAADIAESVQGFIAKTGDIDAARRFSDTFAATATGSGADVQDIANAAADIFQKFDVTGLEEMQAALAKLVFQGKAGAFELKDAASQFAKMSAAAERFGLSKGSKGLATLGGLTQIARSATGSPEQAATAVEAMFRQLTGTHSGKLLKQAGVQVFEKGSTSKTRDIKDILSDTISKTGGSLTKLGGIFGEEGIRAISPLISTFNQTRDAAKGTDAEKTAAGVKALREALEKAIDAPGTWAEFMKDKAQASKSAGAQLDAAWEAVKAKVAEDVVPALVKLAPKLSGLVAGIDPLIAIFEALVMDAQALLDALKALGIIKPKQATPEEQLDKARKALADQEGLMSKRIGPPTADEVAKTAALKAAVDTAEGRAYEKVPVGAKASKMTVEEFAKQYASMSTSEDKSAALLSARGLGSKIASGKASNWLEKNDFVQRFMGDETEEQQRLRTKFQGQKVLEDAETRAGGFGDAVRDSQAVVAALDRNTAATQENTRTGGSKEQGSIVPAGTTQ